MGLEFTLYVVGDTSRTRTAIGNLRAILESAGLDAGAVEIVDLLDHPDRAEAEGIVACPTLVRRLPPPTRRIIGDLSDVDRVRYSMGLA